MFERPDRLSKLRETEIAILPCRDDIWWRLFYGNDVIGIDHRVRRELTLHHEPAASLRANRPAGGRAEDCVLFILFELGCDRRLCHAVGRLWSKRDGAFEDTGGTAEQGVCCHAFRVNFQPIHCVVA